MTPSASRTARFDGEKGIPLPVGNKDSPPGGTRVICQGASCIGAAPRLWIAKSNKTAPRPASAAKRFSTRTPSAGLVALRMTIARRLDLDAR